MQEIYYCEWLPPYLNALRMQKPNGKSRASPQPKRPQRVIRNSQAQHR